MHGEVFGEDDLGVFLGLEQIEEEALFGVVGLRGIAGRGADAAILFLDQIFVGEILVVAEAPGDAGLADGAIRRWPRRGGRPAPWS